MPVYRQLKAYKTCRIENCKVLTRYG